MTGYEPYCAVTRRLFKSSRSATQRTSWTGKQLRKFSHAVANDSSLTTDVWKSALWNQQSSPLLRLPPELRNRILEYNFAGYALTVYTDNADARFTDYDLAIRVIFDAFEDHFLTITYVCSQLRDETKLLTILLCPLVAYTFTVICFLRRLRDLDPVLVRDVTRVVAF